MTTPTPSDSPVPGKRPPGSRPPGSGRGSRALLNATLFVTIVGALAMATLARREASIQQNIYTGILQARLEQSALQMQAYVAPAAANLLWLREWLGSGVADLGDSERLRDLLAPVCAPDSALYVLYVADGAGRHFQMRRNVASWIGDTEPLIPSLHEQAWLGGVGTGEPPTHPRWSGFVSLPDIGRAGLVASLWWPDATAGGVTVAAIGILKDDLDRLAGRLPLSEAGMLLLTGSTDQVFWLSPATGGLFSAETMPELLRSGQPDHVLISRALVERNANGRRDGEIFHFRLQDRNWWGTSYSFSRLDNDLQMTLLLPDDDLATHLDRVADAFTYALFGLLGLGVLALAVIAARYRRRLSAIRRQRLPRIAGEDELRALIAGGESDRVEFKSTLRTNLASGKPGKEVEMSWLKTLAAFLNSAGGILIIGVNDDGETLGLDADGFRNEDKFMLHFNNLIKDHLGLSFARFIGAEIRDLDGKRVFTVACRTAGEPVFLRMGQQESFYVRIGPSSRKLTTSQLLAHLRQE